MARCLAALEPADRLAELRWQEWADAGNERTHSLVVARAAVSRNCAHLACSNLTRDAWSVDEFNDDKMCHRCGAVYCIRACMRADWDAGHEYLCEDLNEELRKQLFSHGGEDTEVQDLMQGILQLSV